jgi:hypothetical protein
MKLKISVALNLILFVVVLMLVGDGISDGIGHFYYRKTVGIVASGAVAALERGDTQTVRDALGSIRSDPDSSALNAAGKKLGVISY